MIQVYCKACGADLTGACYLRNYHEGDKDINLRIVPGHVCDAAQQPAPEQVTGEQEAWDSDCFYDDPCKFCIEPDCDNHMQSRPQPPAGGEG